MKGVEFTFACLELRAEGLGFRVHPDPKIQPKPQTFTVPARIQLFHSQRVHGFLATGWVWLVVGSASGLYTRAHG